VKARDTGETVAVELKVPGCTTHALAALSVAKACGVPLAEAAATWAGSAGSPATEVVGTANEITVIDDFAHTPIRYRPRSKPCTRPGRLMFQPHGYGPIRLMRNALVDALRVGYGITTCWLPEPIHFGGTVDRSVGSRHIVCDIEQRGRKATLLRTAARGDALVKLARRGDRIVVRARATTPSQFA
jgi:UDP-N-acetylmuramate--alanine ligase